MLLSAGTIDAIAGELEPGDFYRAQHGRIYQAACQLHQHGEPVDAITLADHMDSLPSNNGAGSLLDHVGGRQRIHELASLGPSTSTATHYARIVHEMAVLRRIIRVGGEISRLGWDRPGDTPDLVQQAEALTRSLAESGSADTAEPFGHRLHDFLSLDFQAAPALLGTDTDTIIPTGGLVVVAGMPYVGKTTLIIDLIFHLATGRPWLEIPVQRPLNILVIENEGPKHKFQAKLQAKTDAWKTPLQGAVTVHTWRWGSFSFRDPGAAQRLRRHLDDHHIDLIVGDPLDTLGTEGVGSPEDTREFVKLLVPLGLTTNRSFLFLHHFRKEVTISEINQVSGAWGGRLDTLMVLKDTDQPDELRLSFPKLRWADERRPAIIGKVKNTHGFELLAIETHEPEPSDDIIEQSLRKIVSVLTKHRGPLERQILALHCETSTGDRTFNRALSAGFHRGLLAKDRAGRKQTYSLTEEAWL